MTTQEYLNWTRGHGEFHRSDTHENKVPSLDDYDLFAGLSNDEIRELGFEVPSIVEVNLIIIYKCFSIFLS